MPFSFGDWEALCGSYVLFEISPVFHIHQLQVQVVSHGELMVDFSHGGREIVSGEEHSDRDALAPHRSAVHDLVLGDRLALITGDGTCQARAGEG